MRQPSAGRTTRARKPTPEEAVRELENGAHMDQPTFHALYEQTPEGFKAELVGGIVYVMASPVSPRHGRAHIRTALWLALYSDDTEGTDALDNTTSVLSPESEPQPDVALFVIPEYGGRVTIVEDKYVSGPPDLVAEVANTSRAIDLGSKKRDYERAGVREYVVVLPKTESVAWFTRTDAGFAELPAGADGLFRSTVFPGLWLDPRGLFAERSKPLTAALRRGLASPEHAAFVAELAARRKKLRAGKKSPRKAK